MTLSQDEKSNSRTVHVMSYSDKLDMRGRDVIGCLGSDRRDVEKIIGKLAQKKHMNVAMLPLEKITSMTGEIADQVHEWPHATMGRDFQCLTLQFLDDRLITAAWHINCLSKGKNNWWNFWK